MMSRVSGGIPDEMKSEIIKLLGESDLRDVSFENHVVEVPSIDLWRRVAPNGEFTVTIRARRPQPKQTVAELRNDLTVCEKIMTEQMDSAFETVSGWLKKSPPTEDIRPIYGIRNRPPTDTSVGFEFPVTTVVENRNKDILASEDWTFGTVPAPPPLPADHPDAVKVSEECTECRGTGEYRGLVTVEKCGCCGGSGRRP